MENRLHILRQEFKENQKLISMFEKEFPFIIDKRISRALYFFNNRWENV
jgi:hypothetical protein